MSKATCRWPECERPTHARGFCRNHYGQAKVRGNFDAPWNIPRRKKAPPAPCRWPGCDAPSASFGLCNRDAQRARRENNFDDPWVTWAPRRIPATICRWPDCGGGVILAQGMCRLHYDRGRRIGNFEDPWTAWDVRRDCAWCGSPFTTTPIRDSRCCSESCHIDLWRKEHPEKRREHNKAASRRRRAQKFATKVENFTNADVRLIRGDDCYLCGEPINFKLKWPHLKSPSLDHVVPLSRGGSHTLDNAAMAHLDCNRRKASRPASTAPSLTLLSP